MSDHTLFPPGFEFGSICSGIEAASVAFEPLGARAAWLAEVDVAASQVLAHRLGATAPLYPLDPDEPGISAQAERDRRAALKAMARLSWGDRIKNYGDMTVLPALVKERKVSAPPMLCGGTPCQAFSVAGRRGGLNDARGQLTLSFVDLADAIDEVRAEDGEDPTIIVWENVPGVLSDKDNAFGCFLAALAGEDVPLNPSGKRWTDAGVVLGPKRTVAWRIGNAEYFGLAQRRRRVFVVASAREGFDPAAILLEFDGVRRDSPPSREAGEGVTHPTAPCLTGSGRGVERTGDPRGQDPVVACERPGTGRPVGDLAEPTWWDGSPVSQTLDAVLHKGQTMPEKNRFPAVLQPMGYDIKGGLAPHGSLVGTDTAHPLKASDHKDVQVVQSVALRGRDGGATAELGGDAAYALRAAAGGGSDPYVLAPVTAFQTRGSNVAVDDHVTGTLGVNSGSASGSAPMIAFSCKAYGADATQDVAPTMRAMGHAGSHANAGGQIAVCVTGSVTHTLKAEGFDASEDGTGRGQPIVVHGTQDPDINVDFAHPLGRNYGQENAFLGATMAVRRLMPIECHRLQGFPDNWCAVPVGPKGKIAADGPQYKQLGNSWAVNHARWVGMRIAVWLAAQEQPAAPVTEGENDNDALLLWAMAA